MANVKATDLITFTRASAGHALRKVSYGSEICSNGTFDSDASGWTEAGSGQGTITVSNNQAVITATQTGSLAFQSSSTEFEVGKLYQIKVDVVATTDNLTLYNSASTSLTIGALSTGTNVLNYLATDSGFIRIGNLGPVFSTGEGFTLDNISVKEVTFDQPDGTLQLFEHPDNIPRIEYDASGNVLGLLIEEARTNQVQYSTPDSNWSTTTLGTGVTPVVTLNNETSPDGTTSAAKVVLDVGGGTTSGDRSLFLVPTANVTATNSYAGSVWLKGAVGGERVVMRHAGNATYSLFTLTTSWARYDVTETAASSLATMAIGLKGNQSDATATIYVWGAQIEAGEFPTSFIKTTSNTATRAVDLPSISVANFGWNANEGTAVVEVSLTNNVTALQRFIIGTDNSNSRWAYKNAPASVVNVFDGSTAQASTNTLSAGQFSKIASFSDQNNKGITVDGESVKSNSTNGNMTSLPTELRIGHSHSNFHQINGHIKSLNYYPKRLSNAKLQELTS